MVLETDAYMLKKLVLFLLIGLSSGMMAQSRSTMPQRSAEETAMKQTEMLVRELGITDSMTYDTIYRMHLKYERMRMRSNTRQDHLIYLQGITDELKGILTAEQFNQFMNTQLNPESHRPMRPQTNVQRQGASADSIRRQQPIRQQVRL